MGMINFNTLPKENTSQFAVIPKGSYIAKIAKSEMKTPKSEIEVCEARMKDFLKRSKENGK